MYFVLCVLSIKDEFTRVVYFVSDMLDNITKSSIVSHIDTVYKSMSRKELDTYLITHSRLFFYTSSLPNYVYDGAINKILLESFHT